tara:strand:+ start:3772 stop:4791 length:1020 start_codon:yes stop_codon:yes gene_type:complete
MESDLNIKNVKELYNLFDKIYLEEVKPYIENNFPRNKFTEPVYYILDELKLRRFRAAFPLILANYFNISKEKILPIAATSELIFTIALVQDDFFDRDDFRLDIKTAPKKFGKEVSIASSDYSYTYIFKMLKQLVNKVSKETLAKINNSYIEAHERLYASFLMELLTNRDITFSLKKVIELHKAKTIQGTNAFFCTALICEESNNIKLSEELKKYCLNLAVAGQIKNDVYDLYRYAKIRGYSDLLNGYMNYPLAKLLELSNKEEKERIKKLFEENKVNEIVKLIKEKGIITSCIEDCSDYVEKSIDIINKLKINEELRKLLFLWAEGNKINSDQFSSEKR